MLLCLTAFAALLLQDVHWSAGLFGYFPTYSLGAMYACQIYEHAKQQLPELEQQVAAGNFTPLRVRRLQVHAAYLVLWLRCSIEQQVQFCTAAVETRCGST